MDFYFVTFANKVLISWLVVYNRFMIIMIMLGKLRDFTYFYNSLISRLSKIISRSSKIISRCSKIIIVSKKIVLFTKVYKI